MNNNLNSFDCYRRAVMAGLYRGRIESLHQISSIGSLISFLTVPSFLAIVMYFMRGMTVPGSEFSLGAMVLPGLIGMSIAFNGLIESAGTISTDREDGTLLRAKATPYGMTGYLVGKIVTLAFSAMISVILLIIPGLVVAGAEELKLGANTWLLLSVLFVVGMISTVSIGLVLGAIMKSAAQTALLILLAVLLIVPSGIFYPITAMPTWLQWVGQAFPFYWLGLGARSAMLPESMMAMEIGNSWRQVEMFIMLSIWCLAGLALAPGILRRMARRESGTTVNAARERIISKGY